MATADGDPVFDEHYYRHDCGIPYERNDHWLSFFGTIADGIVREFAPERVLDVGCAMGFLVEALRARGVDAWGIDVSEFAISKADEAIRPFCAVASADDILPRHFPNSFDLVTCVEVIEHMPAASARAAVANLARWGRQILFSSSSEDFAEPTHVNVLPPEDWSAMFVEHGMVRDFDVDASFLTPWSVVYGQASVAPGALVRRYDRRLDRYRRENHGLRSGILRLQKAAADTEQRAEAKIDERRSAELEQLRAELASRGRQVADQQRQLAELHVHYEAAIHARDTLRGTNATQLGSIEDKVRLLTTAQAEVTRLEHDLQMSGEHQRELELDLEHERENGRLARERAAAAERRVQDMLDSRSWRAGRLVAAPVKWLRGTLTSSAEKREP